MSTFIKIANDIYKCFNYNGNDINAFVDTLLVSWKPIQMMASHARPQVALRMLRIHAHSTPISHFLDPVTRTALGKDSEVIH